MTAKDLISIVLPVYNGEKYLRESIDSILSQTYQNWELLILDDCSTDGTARIASEYAEGDKRVRYFRNEVNLRLPRNLNRGFSLAKGDYLTWTSDDNRYKPCALEIMLAALKKDPEAQFSFASCRIIDEVGKEIEYIMVNERSRKSIIGSNCVGACFLYTRKVYEEVGDYDPDYTLVEDFDYWQRVFSQFKVVPIEEILYEYRWHDGALTSTMKKEQFNTTLEKMLLKNRALFGKLNMEENYFYYRGLWAARKGSGKHSNPYEWKYNFFAFIYLLAHRIPEKIQRVLHKNIVQERSVH